MKPITETLGVLLSEVGTWHVREGGDSDVVWDVWNTDCGRKVKVREYNRGWPQERAGIRCPDCDWGTVDDTQAAC